MFHFDDVDSADGPGFGRDGVEKRDDLLLVGDGHVESLDVRILSDDLRQEVDGWNLKVLVDGIDVLVSEFLVEITDGERVSQWEANQSVFVHKFTILMMNGDSV